MSDASEVIAKPATSARISALRAISVIPIFEDVDRGPLALHHAVARGAERAAGVTRHHTQPLPGFHPTKTHASPRTHQSASPGRRRNAPSGTPCPIAWFEDAQAVLTA